MSSQLKTITTLTFLMALAFFLRWQYVTNTDFIEPVRADAREYVILATNLANAHVFSMTPNPADSDQPVRPPGYPIFLAAIFALTSQFNSFYWTTLFIQCLIGAATVVVTYILASYALPRPWAIITALFVAFSPHLIVLSAFLLTECLYTFLLILSLTLLVKAYRDDMFWVFGLAGFTLGLAIFVRPALALYPFLCASCLGLFLRKKPDTRHIRITIAFFLATSFLVPASWVLWRSFPQNARPSGQSLLKVAFICGTYPNITFGENIGMPYRDDPNFQKLMDSSYPAIISKIATDITREPARYLGWWLIGKPTMYWSGHEIFNDGLNIYPVRYSWFDNSSFMGGVRWLMLKLQAIFVLLAALSIFFYIKGHYGVEPELSAFPPLICLVLLGYFTLMFMVLAPFARYAMPLTPELFLLSALAVHNLYTRTKQLLVGGS